MRRARLPRCDTLAGTARAAAWPFYTRSPKTCCHAALLSCAIEAASPEEDARTKPPRQLWTVTLLRCARRPFSYSAPSCCDAPSRDPRPCSTRHPPLRRLGSPPSAARRDRWPISWRDPEYPRQRSNSGARAPGGHVLNSVVTPRWRDMSAPFAARRTTRALVSTSSNVDARVSPLQVRGPHDR